MTSGCVENKGWNKKPELKFYIIRNPIKFISIIEESVRKLFIKTSSGKIIKILRVKNYDHMTPANGGIVNYSFVSVPHHHHHHIVSFTTASITILRNNLHQRRIVKWVTT